MKRFLENNEYNKREIANLLELSDKQLVRQFKKWDDKGILEYYAGRGRGHLSGIKFKQNVEFEFVRTIIQNIAFYSAVELTEILEFPISEQSKAEILSAAGAVINKQLPNEEHRLIVKSELPQSIDPLKSTEKDTIFIKLLTERLYDIKEGEVVPNIVLFDKWEGKVLHIHLKRNLRYTDGSNLFAEDVVDCLNKVVAQRNLNEVMNIKLTGLYSLSIALKDKKINIYLFLSSYLTSIYKKSNETIIGTGKYRLEYLNEEEIVLKLNPYLLNDYPYFTQIRFLDDTKEYVSNEFEIMEYIYFKKKIKLLKRKNELLVVNSHLVPNEYLLHQYKDYNLTQITYDEFLVYDFSSFDLDGVLIFDASTHKENHSFYQKIVSRYHFTAAKWEVRKSKMKYNVHLPVGCKNIELLPDGTIDLSLLVKGE